MTNMEFEERNVEESHASPQTNGLTPNHEKFDNYQPAACSVNPAEQVKNKPMICANCQKPILDQYYMWVDQRSFHEACVHCDVCRTPLTESCYAKNYKLYCPQDYKQLQKCHRCSNLIPLSEFVLNVSGHPYHVTCFACDVCHQTLQSGDQYHMNESTNQICCKKCHDQSNNVIGSSVDPEVDSASDFESDDELFSHQSMSMSDISYLSGYGGANDVHPNHVMLQRKNSGKVRLSPMTSCSDGKRIKRPRTILTTAQRRKFKASFEVSQKPCRKVRETLAAETGLSPRVVQVWFQNQRAKVKKLARRQQSDGHNSQAGQRSRRKKTLDSDSDNELSSPSSYVSMPTALQTSFYHETFRSPGSLQTSPTTSVTDITSYHQVTPNTHDPAPEFLYDDFDNNLFSGGETFVTSSTPSTTHLASVNMETSHQGEQVGTLSRPSSDYNINAASSYQNAAHDGDLLPESSPQDVFPQFGTLQPLNTFPNHATNEGNPIDRLMCMQSTFFQT